MLRDRALLHVLFFWGMRHAEVTNLNRDDVQDGRAYEALIVGKGDKEHNVFFDTEVQSAIRTYLEARGDKLRPLFLRDYNNRGVQVPPAAKRSHKPLDTVFYGEHVFYT